MIDIGMMNELVVHEKFKEGYYLRAPDFDIDVILPFQEITSDINIGDVLNVFVFVDNQDRPIATLVRPSAVVGEFAVMRVRESHQFGAFMAWGIAKDLLVPDSEQREAMGINKSYIVRVCLDERTNKVYGTTKTGKYIQDSEFDIKEGDKVSIIPASKEELGYRSLINNKFIGMIYYNEVFQDIKLGEKLEGVVKKLRSDGLVDAALQVQGFTNIVNSQDRILAYLEQKGGKSHLHDKSPPEEISSLLNMSKKTFKSSIGMLYRQKKIVINKDGIELIKNKT